MSSQGSNANLNGKKFEEIVINNFFKDLEDNGYQIDEESIRSNNGKILYCEIYKNGEIHTGKPYAMYSSQEGFNDIFLVKQKIIPSIEKKPDGLLYFPDRDYIQILEIKKQSGNGSVIEKLYGCDGIRDYDYKKEIFHNKYTVDMTYVLAAFFNKPRNERYFNYMSDRNVQYFFGKRFPLDKIGFETVNKYVEKEKNPYQLF